MSIMMTSVGAFLDFDRIRLAAMSEYLLKTPERRRRSGQIGERGPGAGAPRGGAAGGTDLGGWRRAGSWASSASVMSATSRAAAFMASASGRVGLGDAGHLADVLAGGGLDLLAGGGRFESTQLGDVSTHGGHGTSGSPPLTMAQG